MQGAGDKSSLFGRDVEIAALHGSVARAARRDGHVVVVEGEAGIGKSALAESVVTAAAAEGFAVLAAGGDEMTRARPFSPLLAALQLEEGSSDDASGTGGVRGLLAATQRGGSSLLSASSADRQHAVADMLAGLLAEAAQREPTLLLVEDLHWVDASTTLALRAAGRRTPGLPFLLLLTTRPPATDEAVRDVRLLAAGGGERLLLGPLPEHALDALVVAHAGLPPGPVLRGLLAGTRGNPLLAAELLRGLIDEGLAVEVDGTLEAPADALPVSFAEQVLDRVSHLDHDARGVLRLGAILGGSFSLADLAAASGRPTLALVEPVQSALRAGLLEEHGDRLTFRHELVRAAIYDALPESVRAGVHRHVAVTLAGTAAPAVTVAAHFARGGQPGDTTAIEWLQRAAQEVMASAPETARALLERACELAPVGSPLRSAIDVDRLEAIGLCGGLHDVEGLSEHLLRTLGDEQQRNRVRQLRAAALLLLNRGGEAGEELLTVAEGLSGPESVRALAEAAICFLAAADTARADETALHARDAAGAPGTGIGHGLALAVLSRRAGTLLQFDESLRLAEQGLAAAERDGDPDAHMYQPLFFTAMSLYDLDRFDDAVAHVAAGRAVSRDRGWQVSAAPYAGMAALIHLRAGQLDAAAQASGEGVALASRLATGMCHALVALTALHTDDLEAADEAVAAAERAVDDGTAMLGLDLLLLARGLVEEACGRMDAAAATLHDAWAMFVDLSLENLAGAIAPDAVRLSVACGKTTHADDVTAFLTDAATRIDLPSWHGAAAVARGLSTGEPALLLEGVAHYRTSPRILATGQAIEHAGRALADNGDVAGARRLLREAVAIFEECGATRDSRRASVALRAAGGRRRGARTQPYATGWRALSAAERQVAELVATGLPNAEVAARLFVSRRTVETHLYRIYGKLGVRSRVELAMLVGQPAQTRSP
jgi:DNA-binding CsgD family transcriptional regulator